MLLDGYSRHPFEQRRSALSRQLGGKPALIASGAPSPRNYPANTYPFRASSHFLYLFGLPLRGAFALLEGGAWTVFVPEPTPNNALWHGPEPTLAELADALGCAVRPVSRLEGAVEGKPAATLAAADPGTQQRQRDLLQRPVKSGSFEGDDLKLADAMVGLRMVHDQHAVLELRAAAEATLAAHLAGMRVSRPGVTEPQVRAAMEAEIIARDMTTAYGSIVSVHGEVLHNEFYSNVLAAGDLLLADVGAESRGGFAGDVTRTWPVTAAFSSTQRELYQMLLDVQKDTVAHVRPGLNYGELHMRATRGIGQGLVDLGILKGQTDDLIEAGAVALFFPHGVGHLLGLDVHDMEDLGDRAGYSPGRQRSTSFGLKTLRLNRDLVAGMAVTIEPGFYQVPAILQNPELGQSNELRPMVDWTTLARFKDVRGIRIEDDVLVTANGHEVLSAAIPKEIAAIESVVGA